MKLTALAVVLLALGVVVGLALRSSATEAAPKWATPEFVDDSIEAFNQAVVQPIAATVGQLQGDVTDLDQRVTALETAAPPQQREDQIVLFAPNQFHGPLIRNTRTTYSDLQDIGPALLGLDPADYPSGASFQFEATWRTVGNTTSCLRLVDATTNAPVAGSEVCRTSTEGEVVRLRSSSMTLAPAEHDYVVEGKCVVLPDELCPSFPLVGAARIIVEWTE